MNFIKKIDENKNITNYKNIKEAAVSVDTKFDLWKVEMLIQNAIKTGRKAFKANWKLIKKS